MQQHLWLNAIMCFHFPHVYLIRSKFLVLQAPCYISQAYVGPQTCQPPPHFPCSKCHSGINRLRVVIEDKMVGPPPDMKVAGTYHPGMLMWPMLLQWNLHKWQGLGWSLPPPKQIVHRNLNLFHNNVFIGMILLLLPVYN